MLALSVRPRLKSLTQTLTSQTPTRIPPQLSSPYSSSSSQSLKKKSTNKHETTTHDDSSVLNRDPNSPPRLLVVQPRLRPATFLQAKLNEALCLANSLEEQREGFFALDFFDKPLSPHLLVQNPILRSSVGRADTYFGPGTVGNIKAHLHAAEDKEEVDAVFVNAILTAVQQRNLEQVLGKPVLDRVGLIIEIFNAHAHTKEAKLQAQLAALMYKKSRLVRVRGPRGRYTFGEFGEAQVVSARGRGSGGQGFVSGAGETELQLQRRRIVEKRTLLLTQIEEIRRTRALQRDARRRHGLHDQRLPTVAVVGYTNAGKSTLVSALSESDLYSDSRLFATLDCRLRSVILPSGRKVLLSDTVGFISDLPVQLVRAFHATLEEVVEADLLVHVIDCTAPNLDEHRATVLQVLQQIGVSKEKIQNMIEVWNKIDYEKQEDDDKYLYGGEINDANPSSLSGDEGDDVGSELSTRIDDDKINNFAAVDDGTGDFEASIDDEQGDCSDGWLSSEDDQEMVGDRWLKTLDDQHGEASDDSGLKENLHSQAERGPHVRTSAITGVGLQELLEFIDERLKTQDKELEKAQQVLERDIFNRKWRPPRKDDSSMPVER